MRRALNDSPNLLSPNDLTQLRVAMASGREISLTRTLGGFSMTASTRTATPVWGCATLVRLERQRGCVYSRQYFKTVEEMVAYI